ncbi:Hint domain-containing protein [Phaeobacter sp.]|uniref:Hint domain-containing protein n=1 Tax=Phaeobacter sp. TaxID=1902409 RepID=UPI0025FF40F6|nr:Hint domain-containing protein [Phaeobacter sp.]
MISGLKGTYAIAGGQAEVDGRWGASLAAVVPGACWRWTGDLRRLDGPTTVMNLQPYAAAADFRHRAALGANRVMGMVREDRPKGALRPRGGAPRDAHDERLLRDAYFVVSDGIANYTVFVIPVESGAGPILVFVDDVPPRARDLWVVKTALPVTDGAWELSQPYSRRRRMGRRSGLAAGTSVATPDGTRLVEELQPGDWVTTRDSSAQQVTWVAHQRVSGARLFAEPGLRPILVPSGALGSGQPDGQLLLSPDQRILVKGEQVACLFNAPEVFVKAVDLLGVADIRVDLSVCDVTYVQLLLPQHEVIWANSVPTESFLPETDALACLPAQDQESLDRVCPGVLADPQRYGTSVRRRLARAEAELFKFAA